MIYDPVGGPYSEPALRAIAWEGRFLVVGFAAGDIPKIPLNLALLKGCQIVGVFWGAFVGREPERHRRNAERADAALERRQAPATRVVHLSARARQRRRSVSSPTARRWARSSSPSCSCTWPAWVRNKNVDKRYPDKYYPSMQLGEGVEWATHCCTVLALDPARADDAGRTSRRVPRRSAVLPGEAPAGLGAGRHRGVDRRSQRRVPARPRDKRHHAAAGRAGGRG